MKILLILLFTIIPFIGYSQKFYILYEDVKDKSIVEDQVSELGYTLSTGTHKGLKKQLAKVPSWYIDKTV